MSTRRAARLRSPDGALRDLKALRRSYPPLQKTWNSDPFRVLIGTILSQRTKDERTAVATRQLFARFPDVRSLAAARPEEVEPLVRPAGFYRTKARRIIEVARLLLERSGGRVPATMGELLELPSVGRKTANCVLVYGFGVAAIPVDTHVHRIANRLGWVRTRTPEETEEALRTAIPERHWTEVNDLLVAFGQDTCRPVAPWCGSCTVYPGCRWAGKAARRHRTHPGRLRAEPS